LLGHELISFELGRVVGTPGALAKMQDAGQDVLEFLQRHMAGYALSRHHTAAALAHYAGTRCLFDRGN
jgi:hypothetical protein